jgi:plastocyanin
MKRGVLVLGVLAVLLLVACQAAVDDAPPVPDSAGTDTVDDVVVDTEMPVPPAPGEEVVDEVVVEEDVVEPTGTTHTVEITSKSFVPGVITIAVGDTVTFVNKHSAKSWPASNVHPSHTRYPGSSITKCGTDDESMIFDACKGLAEGEEYSFTFDEEGVWEYHDHLNSRFGGSVVVR